MSLLAIESLHGGYGEMDILHGVDLEVGADEIVAIIGPNGAGKSTLIKGVFGLIRITKGRIRFDGADVTGMAPEKLVAMGLSYVPQERNVFPNLTVQENLEMAPFSPKAISRRRWTRSMSCFHRSPRSASSRRPSSRAASARWSPWAGR